ncbi:hypothetical protein EVAR_10138_1 [Eumeta japonica]|uniref:Uncharacterized protein n=1 Tax=Eumeta variegata TaxID=151549 RepID=A0A4C1UD35_EUMVA|nr:hypothetical protein EVAR_10138_1 [Eumeta japonica]
MAWAGGYGLSWRKSSRLRTAIFAVRAWARAPRRQVAAHANGKSVISDHYRGGEQRFERLVLASHGWQYHPLPDDSLSEKSGGPLPIHHRTHFPLSACSPLHLPLSSPSAYTFLHQISYS